MEIKIKFDNWCIEQNQINQKHYLNEKNLIEFYEIDVNVLKKGLKKIFKYEFAILNAFSWFEVIFCQISASHYKKNTILMYSSRHFWYLHLVERLICHFIGRKVNLAGFYSYLSFKQTNSPPYLCTRSDWLGRNYS